VARAGFVEVDQPHVEHASAITLARDLPSLDALHLAVALMLPGEDLVTATGDRGLHAAASAEEACTDGRHAHIHREAEAPLTS
jgi:predicted nucleic acid-binding protein